MPVEFLPIVSMLVCSRISRKIVTHLAFSILFALSSEIVVGRFAAADSGRLPRAPSLPSSFMCASWEERDASVRRYQLVGRKVKQARWLAMLAYAYHVRKRHYKLAALYDFGMHRGYGFQRFLVPDPANRQSGKKKTAAGIATEHQVRV